MSYDPQLEAFLKACAERERDQTEEAVEYDRMNPDTYDPEPIYY